MTTVAILPVASPQGAISYQAVSGDHMAAGNTAGEALDALAAQFPEVNAESLVVIQRFRPDRYFSSDQQRRLQDLMIRWQENPGEGRIWSAAEQTELASLVEAELAATARRAEETAKGLGR